MAVERFEIVVETRGTQRVQRELSDIGRTARSTTSLLGLMRSALVVIATARVLTGFSDLVDSFTNMRNQIKLVTNSAEEMNAVFESLNQLSTRTRTDLDANVTLFTRMARATTHLTLTYKQLLEATETAALAIKISGATSQEARNALIQFSQGLAAGALRGDELRSVVEQLPKLADVIAKAFTQAGKAVSGGQLAAFAKANPGVLKTQITVDQLRKSLGELQLEFKNFAPTIADGFTLLNNALVVYLGRVNEATGAGASFSRLLASLAQNIGLVVNALVALAGIVVFNFLIRQLAQLGTTVSFVGTASKGAFNTMSRAAAVALVPVRALPIAFVAVGTAATTMGRLVATSSRAAGAAILGITASLRVAGAASSGFGALVVGAFRGAAAQALALARSLTVVVGIMGGVTKAIALLAAISAASAVGALTRAFQLLVAPLRGAIVGFQLLVSVSGGVAAALRVIASLSLASVFNAMRVALLGAATAAKAFSLAIITNPLFLGGAAIVGALVAAFFLLRKPIEDLIDSIGGLKNIWKNAVSAIVALLSVLIDDWDLLPGAIADISVRAVNGMIDIFERGVNGVTGLLNNLGADIKPVNLGRFTTAYVGQADALKGFLKNQFNKAFEEGIDKTTLGKTIDGIVSFVEGKAPDITEVLLGRSPKGAGTGANLGDKVEELKGKMRGIIASLSPLFDANNRFAELTKAIAQAAKAGIDLKASFGLTADELKTRLGRELAGVGNDAVLTADRFKILEAQYKAGRVSATEFGIAQRRLKNELFDGSRSAIAAVSPLEAYNQKLQETKDLIDEAIERSRKSVAAGGPSFEFSLPDEELQRRTVRDLIGIGNATTDYREELAKLDTSQAQSAASTRELSVRRRELTAAFQQDINSLVASVSPIAAATQQLAQAKLTIDKALAQGQAVPLGEEEILRRMTRELVGAGNAAEIYADKMQMLNQALSAGSVNMEEFQNLSRKARLEMLENATTMEAGFSRAFLKLEDAVANASTAAEDLLTKAFDVAGTALDEFVRKGTFDLNALGQEFASFFLKLGMQQLQVGIGNLLGFGTGVQGGGFNLFGSLFKGLFGAANGASFPVGAGMFPSIPGGMDNRLVAFKARDGEHVTVTKPGQNGPGQTVNVNFNITTQDADSFQRSMGQISARTSAALSRAARRNG